MPKKGKGSAKGAKKVEFTVKLPSGEVLKVEARATDCLPSIRICVQEAIDADEEKRQANSEQGESKEKGDISEATREQRAKAIELMLEGGLITDLSPELPITELGIIGKELELVPPKPQSGRGTFRFPNSALYIGEWQVFEGKQHRHGQGRLELCGEVYEGAWEKDQMTGKGKYLFNSGSTYEGDWKNAKYNGKGTYKWADGSAYEGEWSDNIMSGYGTFTTQSGDRFQGQFSKNKFLNDKGHWLPVPHSVDYV